MMLNLVCFNMKGCFIRTMWNLQFYSDNNPVLIAFFVFTNDTFSSSHYQMQCFYYCVSAVDKTKYAYKGACVMNIKDKLSSLALIPLYGSLIWVNSMENTTAFFLYHEAVHGDVVVGRSSSQCQWLKNVCRQFSVTGLGEVAPDD